MNVLLVYPKYPNTFWSFSEALKYISKKAAFPPLGLLTVAAMLPDTWDKKLVDMNTRKLKPEDIAWADMVLISAMIVQKDSAKEVIALCNAAKKTVVAGGPLFTTQHEEYSGVDHFVLNEAEITLPLFLNDLKRGTAKKRYTSELRTDIDTTPIPLWSLIKLRDYSSMAVQFSRGCPFNCEFCDIIIMNGRTPRTKATARFINEIDSLYTNGYRGGVFIVDDNFIGNKRSVKAMLIELIAWQEKHGFPFHFLTEASTNLADDDELMKLLRAANFNKVFLGIETPSIEALEACGKHQNASRDLVESVRILHRNGIQVMGGFIVGFDSDPITIFKAQIEFIQKTGVVTAMVGLLNAMPKTRLWDRLKAEKRLKSVTTGENTDGFLNFKSRMPESTLISGFKEILATIYSPKKYYERVRTFLKDFKPMHHPSFSIEQLKPLIRSFIRIGIFSRSRFRFWGLLSRTFFTKPVLLPLAIELSILGTHFEKVVERLAPA